MHLSDGGGEGSYHDAVGIEQVDEGSCRGQASGAGVLAASLAASMQGMCQCTHVQPCSAAPAVAAAAGLCIVFGFVLFFFYLNHWRQLKNKMNQQLHKFSMTSDCSRSCWRGRALVHVRPCVRGNAVCLCLKVHRRRPAVLLTCCAPVHDGSGGCRGWGCNQQQLTTTNNNSRTTRSC